MTITAKINVTKIEKARLFKGENGTYLDIVLIETPNGKFGQDFMICQSVSKEERDRGVRGPILGGGKIAGKKSTQQPAAEPTTKKDDDWPGF